MNSDDDFLSFLFSVPLRSEMCVSGLVLATWAVAHDRTPSVPCPLPGAPCHSKDQALSPATTPYSF